jgi:aldose sugar dehydrogenase
MNRLAYSLCLLSLASVLVLCSFVYDSKLFGQPILREPEFQLEKIVDGLSRPTGISFLGPDDFLVIEEDTGMVKRVVNGQISQTILDVAVSTEDSRGLIGIDTATVGNQTFVFLYFTESSSSQDGGEPLGNRLYRYDLINSNNSLVNPKLLLDLPAGPGSQDNGGPVLAGPHNNVYSVIGHVEGDNDRGHETRAQNFENGPEADGTSGVHRVTQDGKIVGSGILGPTLPLATYYARGLETVSEWILTL